MSKVDAMNDSAHNFPGNGKADMEGKIAHDEPGEPAYVGKGQWYHIGFHVTAAVASVPTLGLPYALSLMGWGGGLVSLVAGGAVTLFTAFLIAGMAEFGGKRHIRFRDLSAAIYGRTGYWLVTPFQMAICVGTTIANHIVAGQAMKALSVIATGGSALTLTEWIIVFMVFNLLIAQYPHMHSLRFVNSIATFSTISFSAIAVGLSLYSGLNNPEPRDYSVPTDPTELLWSIFNGLGIMAFAYGNTVLPEIGATAVHPADVTMRRGIMMGYVTIVCAYLMVSITGYWAFGNSVGSLVLSSLTDPSWAVMLAWAFAIVQLVGTTQTYCHPVYELCDKTMGNILAPVWSLRNVAVRLVCRTVFICVCAFIGMMLPFFGDMMGIIGALGFTPMDFVLPQFLWIAAYKPTGPKKWFALLVALIYAIVGVMALIASVRGIVKNAVTYRLFANL